MLTHIDSDHKPTMVDVGEKDITTRIAEATSSVELPPSIVACLNEGDIVTKKGPVIATAIIAGTMAAKKTHDLIPFCHPLPIESIKIQIEPLETSFRITCTVKATHKTGVEMEALTGASVAALTIYDMCKAISPEMVISQTLLTSKTGGRRDYVKRIT